VSTTRDGALANERDRHGMGTDAVACDAARSVGGIEEGGRMNALWVVLVAVVAVGCQFSPDIVRFLSDNSMSRSITRTPP
jgi:hypothetical protein